MLKPGGTCFATYFLLNERTRQSVAPEDFRYPVDATGVCLAVSTVEFEKAVAFDEPFIHRIHGEHGLEIQESVRYGRWATLDGGPTFQDIVVARRA